MLLAFFFAAVAIPAFGLSVTTPNAQDFWVLGMENVIGWTTAAGDPTLVSITVTTSANDSFSGNFAIAQDVPVKNLSFTVTNVTIVPDSGYVVNLVNTTNLTQIFASSQPFSVEPNGTTPPNLASITAPGASAATPSNTSPTSSNSSSSSSNSTSGTSPSPSKNASSRSMDAASASMLGMLAVTAVMSIFGAVLTL